MRDRILNLIADLTWKRPVTVVLVAMALAAICIWYAASFLKLNANTDDLIAPERQYMVEYRQFLQEFGDLEYINVVVENTGDAARAEAAVDALTARLRKITDVSAAYGSVERAEQLRIASRAMSEKELEQFTLTARAFGVLRKGNGARAVHETVERLKQLVQQGMGMTPEQQQKAGGAAVFLANVIASAKEGSQSEKELALLIGRDAKPEYFKSTTGRFYFINVMSEKDYRTLSVIEEPLRRIRAVIEEVRREFPPPGVVIGLTGKPVLQADEMATTDADMTRAAMIAMALCSIVFMVAFGSVVRPLLAVVAFACGAAWTYGLATAAVGQLNLLSIVFILILVGIGLDYGVHVVSRYREYRAVTDVRGAVSGAILTAGRGNITGSISGATVFFMALFTTFQGLRELGVIAGSGLVLCMTAMTVVLPALLVIVNRWRASAHLPTRAEPLHPEDKAPGMLGWILARPGTVLVVAAVFTLAFCWAPLQLRFEYNLLKLQAAGLESVRFSRRIMADSADSSWFGAVVAENEAQALEVIEKARGKQSIGMIHSVFDVIQPQTERRRELRKRLHAVEDAVTGTAKAAADDSWSVKDLEACTAGLNFIVMGARRQAPDEVKRLEGIDAAIKSLIVEMRSGEPGAAAVKARVEENVRRVGHSLDLMLEGDALELRAALPDGVRDRFMSPGGRLLIMLHPKEDVWDLEPMRRFVTEMREAAPHVTGVPVTQYESIGDMMNSFKLMSLLSLGVILVIVTVDFRRPRDILLALLPLVVGGLWTAEAMAVLDIPFNLANFFSVPILIGLSVNGSVYVLHRNREGGATRFTLGATRRAVLVTTLTTMIGFGCLMLAHHNGLRSLGAVMIIGTASTLAATLIVLPAVLAWMEGRKDSRPQVA